VRNEEAQLIADYLGGDHEAMATVDRWIQQAAWPFRQRLSHLWDDLLQDVRLEVTRLLKEEKFRGDSSLKTYLWRVTANACVDRVRSHRKVHFEDVEVVDQRGDAPRANADELAAGRDARDVALRVLAQVPEECRRLFRLLFEGLSYQQMSERLGVSEGALRVRVLRCRRRALAVRDALLGGPPLPGNVTA
jgi:RNA polymerase sigma factor (sigma-70 family)